MYVCVVVVGRVIYISQLSAFDGPKEGGLAFFIILSAPAP